MDFDLITWASDINQVMQDENFLLAGYTARRYRTWNLLNCQLLIVAI